MVLAVRSSLPLAMLNQSVASIADEVEHMLEAPATVAGEEAGELCNAAAGYARMNSMLCSTGASSQS